MRQAEDVDVKRSIYVDEHLPQALRDAKICAEMELSRNRLSSLLLCYHLRVESMKCDGLQIRYAEEVRAEMVQEFVRCRGLSQ